MRIEFLRFKASDGVQLRGWYTDCPGEVAVIHVHGMSGNGYENLFLDVQRKAYQDSGISFFTFDNRGCGIISHFKSDQGTKVGGSCFEIFEESAEDIQGAIDLLKSKGKKKFILQGHSLGCSKVVNYLMSSNSDEFIRVILLAPTDMVGWANTDSNHQQYLQRAYDLIKQNKPEELVSAECWVDKTPLSAQTYPSICEEGSVVDTYGSRSGGALLSRLNKPTVIIYGDQDGGILKVDGDISTWEERAKKIINPRTTIKTIPGANHGFNGFEDMLAEITTNFADETTKNT